MQNPLESDLGTHLESGTLGLSRGDTTLKPTRIRVWEPLKIGDPLDSLEVIPRVSPPESDLGTHLESGTLWTLKRRYHV